MNIFAIQMWPLITKRITRANLIACYHLNECYFYARFLLTRYNSNFSRKINRFSVDFLSIFHSFISRVILFYSLFVEYFALLPNARNIAIKIDFKHSTLS